MQRTRACAGRRAHFEYQPSHQPAERHRSTTIPGAAAHTSRNTSPTLVAAWRAAAELSNFGVAVRTFALAIGRRWEE
ncbi:MAG: hypothetical protein ACLQU1_38935 [Bryobacteraceae bacterium]